jgi:acylphosphatase
MTRIARHVRVTGRVQGVFFRQSTCNRAREFGVTGWVRNCADGSVEAQVEGEEQEVQAMLDWLHKGPPDAQVNDVEISEAEPKNLPGFELVRSR